MNVEDAIRNRRSIRRFTDEPVSATDLRDLLTLATMAPSISNRQMWRFIVVTGDTREMLYRMVERRIDDLSSTQEMVRTPKRVETLRQKAAVLEAAPALIVVVNQGYNSELEKVLVERGLKNEEVQHLFSHPDIQSVSALAAFFILAAEERGYGTCWMTDILIAQRDFQAALGLQPDESVLALVAIGKPAETPPAKDRKPIDELIEWM
ncbi:MAG: nitroreductase family protein [Armatimonadota bacterium]